MAVPVKRAVVKLVGKDGSGKTSLLNSLMRLMFNKTQESSPAIQIQTIQQMDDSNHWLALRERDIENYLGASMYKKAKKEERYVQRVSMAEF